MTTITTPALTAEKVLAVQSTVGPARVTVQDKPAALAPEPGIKRSLTGISMFDVLPKVRSKSGESKKRSVSARGTPAVAAEVKVSAQAQIATANTGSSSVTDAAALPWSVSLPGGGVKLGHSSSGGTASGTLGLRPKLAALLSGRNTPISKPATPTPVTPTYTVDGAKPVPMLPTDGVQQSPLNLATKPGASAAAVTTSRTASALANTGTVAPNLLEASYVTKIGISLTEALNRIFPASSAALASAHPSSAGTTDCPIVFKGAVVPRVDKSVDFADTLVRELHAAASDPYLLRSLLRSAVLKTLSIFLSRLDAIAMLIAAEPTLLVVAQNLKEAEQPPPVQKIAFVVYRTAGVVRRGLLRAGLGTAINAASVSIADMPKFVRETLDPWAVKLDMVMSRVWQPILDGIKQSAIETITHNIDPALRGPAPALQSDALNPATPEAQVVVGNQPRAAGIMSSAIFGGGSAANPANAATAGAASTYAAYLRDLHNILAAASRTFAWITLPSNVTGDHTRVPVDADVQRWRVAIGSALVWKMLLYTSSCRADTAGQAIGRRRTPLSGSALTARDDSQPYIPRDYASAGAHQAGTRRSASALGLGRFGRPVPNGKRSPSPPALKELLATKSMLPDLVAFESVVKQFVSPVIGSAAASHTADEPPCDAGSSCKICEGRYIPADVEESDDEDMLPREAMQEAMTALSATIVFFRAFSQLANPAETLLTAVTNVDNIKHAMWLGICPNLVRAMDTMPALILMQAIVTHMPVTCGISPTYMLWKSTWEDYANTMRGFHSAEEWVPEIGWELLKECDAAAPSAQDQSTSGAPERNGNVKWIRLLRRAIVDLAEVDDTVPAQ